MRSPDTLVPNFNPSARNPGQNLWRQVLPIVLILVVSTALGLTITWIGANLEAYKLRILTLIIVLAVSIAYQLTAALRSGHWWQPYTFFILMYIGYILDGLYLLTGGEAVGGFHLTRHNSYAVTLALVGAILGIWSFWAGYRTLQHYSGYKLKTIVPTPVFPRLSNVWVLRLWTAVLSFLSVVGWVAFVRSSGGLMYLLTNIYLHTQLRSSAAFKTAGTQCLVVIWLWMAYDKNFYRKRSAWIITAIAAISLLVYGARTALLELGLIFLAYGIYTKWGTDETKVKERRVRRRTKATTLSRILIGGILGLAVVIGMRAWRKSSHHQPGVSGASAVNQLISIESVSRELFGQGNLASLEMFSRIIEKTPSRVLNFQYGTTYLEFFIAPIPRSLWPEKPPSLGVQLKRVLVDAKAEGGIPPSMVGELYFNFDMFGIFVGMFLWGAICWHIYKTQVLERGTTPTVFLRYLIFIVYCLMPWVRTNFAIMAIHFSTLIIPYLIATQTINWCCLRRRRTLVANRGVSHLAMQGYQRRQLY